MKSRQTKYIRVALQRSYFNESWPKLTAFFGEQIQRPFRLAKHSILRFFAVERLELKFESERLMVG